ncbi:hypothetical protein BJX70DRAFT_396665 [Aspergillus crustosus]
MSLASRITKPRPTQPRRLRRVASKISRNPKRYENMEQREALLEYMRLEDEIKRHSRCIADLEKRMDDIVRWKPAVQRLAEEAAYDVEAAGDADTGIEIQTGMGEGAVGGSDPFSLI